MEFVVTLLFGLAALTASQADGLCTSSRGIPHNVKQLDFQGMCYAFFGGNWLEYADARGRCLGHGGILATPKTQAVNDFLRTKLGARAWIGLNDRGVEKVFRWEDGSRLNHPNGFHMFRGSNEGPRDGLIQPKVEDCVLLDPRGTWHDVRCRDFKYLFGKVDVHKNFICQFRIPATTASTTTRTMEPNTTDNQPETTENQPETTEAQPETTETQSASTEAQPETTEAQPETTEAQPATTDASQTTEAAQTTDAAQTTGAAQTTDAAQSTAPSDSAQCPPFECDLDCFMDDFVLDQKTGCLRCECDAKK